MDFPKLMWIIQQGKLHFHRADDFKDSFEGTTPKALKQLRKKSLKEAQSKVGPDEIDLIESWNHGMKNLRKTLFLNCWHANNTESAAMWNLYGNEGKSIAVVSTIGRLKKAFQKIDDSVYIGDLTYVDFYKDLDELDPVTKGKIANVINRTDTTTAFQQILFKRIEFSHEQEVRAVILDMSHLSDRNQAQQPYINIPIDIDQLIECIYISPTAPDWFSKVVEETVEESHIKLTSENIHPSRLDEEPWN